MRSFMASMSAEIRSSSATRTPFFSGGFYREYRKA
jgi:hypothetical protein